MDVFMRESISLSSLMSIGTDIRLMISSASFKALLYAEMMTTGWMSRSNCARDCARISPAMALHQHIQRVLTQLIIPKMITLVVPSPHSSSCVRLSSIMFLAAGCATSISRRIAFPSFVSLNERASVPNRVKSYQTHRMPPIGSSIIFSMAFGPKHVRITSATVFHTKLLD